MLIISYHEKVKSVSIYWAITRPDTWCRISGHWPLPSWDGRGEHDPYRQAFKLYYFQQPHPFCLQAVMHSVPRLNNQTQPSFRDIPYFLYNLPLSHFYWRNLSGLQERFSALLTPYLFSVKAMKMNSGPRVFKAESCFCHCTFSLRVALRSYMATLVPQFPPL